MNVAHRKGGAWNTSILHPTPTEFQSIKPSLLSQEGRGLEHADLWELHPDLQAENVKNQINKCAPSTLTFFFTLNPYILLTLNTHLLLTLNPYLLLMSEVLLYSLL